MISECVELCESFNIEQRLFDSWSFALIDNIGIPPTCEMMADAIVI